MRSVKVDNFEIFEDGSVINTETIRKYPPAFSRQIYLPNKTSYILPIAKILLSAFKPLPKDLLPWAEYAVPTRIDRNIESVGIDNLKWDFNKSVKQKIPESLRRKYGIDLYSTIRKRTPVSVYYIQYAEGYYEEISALELAEKYGILPKYTQNDFTVKSPYTGAVYRVSRNIPEL